MESFTYSDHYSTYCVTLDFSKNKNIFLKFLNINKVFGVALISQILSNPYSCDEGTILIINGKEINDIKKYDVLDVHNIFCEILSQISSEWVEIIAEIHYEDYECYNFQKQNIYFIEDADHDTFYYFELEMSRRTK
jgi:hypothetical protein